MHVTRSGFKLGRTRPLIAGVVIVLLASTGVLRAETVLVSELPQNTHVHGVAVDPVDPAYLMIATHHGLFRAGPDGKAERISVVQDFMGFTQHPTDASTLFASGHPASGGNLGFIASTDQGKTWVQVSPGLNGPVDFHQLTISPADPDVVYGAYGELQVSRDGGKSWAIAGKRPEKLIDLAASAKSADTVYAATETGLMISTDAGRGWSPLLEGAPASVVEVTRDGTIYAFVLGRGLMRASEGEELLPVGDDLGKSVLLHLAVDPNDPARIYAATGHSQILVTDDGGKTWDQFGR